MYLARLRGPWPTESIPRGRQRPRVLDRRGRGENLHDLLPLPWTEEALDHLTARVHHAQQRLGRRLSPRIPRATSATSTPRCRSGSSLGELARRTGAGLLLDVNNVFVTARNHGFSPRWFLDGLPAWTVEQFHLSGHDDSGPVSIDTHDREVSPEVWELFRYAVHRFGPRPTIVEWDDQIPPFSTLLDQARRATWCWRRWPMSPLALAG